MAHQKYLIYLMMMIQICFGTDKKLGDNKELDGYKADTIDVSQTADLFSGQHNFNNNKINKN